MADPQNYRDEAARLRREAENTQDPEIKRLMLELAEICEELAEYQEHKGS